MADDKGLAEYAEFIAGQPIEHEVALGQPTVATAYWAARRRGWTNEQIVPDAAATFRRGGGVGMVVTRLRSLAEQSPTARSEPGKGERKMRCPRGCGRPHYSDQSCECQLCHRQGAYMVVNSVGAVHADCYSGRDTHPERVDPRTLPPAARPYDEPVLTPEMTRERMALLGRIQRRRLDPDEGERLMRELIAEQYAR